MLVLSRKPGEKLCIGSNIVVTILEVKGNRVRIGIDAPRSVAVARAELTPPTPEGRLDLPTPDFTIECVN